MVENYCKGYPKGEILFSSKMGGDTFESGTTEHRPNLPGNHKVHERKIVRPLVGTIHSYVGGIKKHQASNRRTTSPYFFGDHARGDRKKIENWGVH